MPTALERLQENALLRLSGATLGGVNAELFNTLDDACRRWNLWRETLQFRRGEPGEPLEAIVPDGREVVMLLTVDPDGRPISEFSSAAERIFIAGDAPGVDIVDTMASFAPTPVLGDPEDWFPAELYTRHYSLLLNGVLGRMMAHSAKPYSDRQMAVAHTRMYNSAGAIAKTLTDNGYARGAQRWSFPTWL